MIKYIWTSAAVLGTMVALPTVADARPPYLEALADGTEAQIEEPACDLPGMTCGLCHQPNEGERNENVAVGGAGIDASMRNGPFFESLTGVGGWNPMPGSVGPNADSLLNMVVPMMVADNVDSDGDGVGDIEELSLGYNPLLAYDEADPALSQLCGDAMPFPDVGGTASTSDGSTGDSGDSTGDPDPTTGGPTDPTTGGPTDPDTGDEEASAEGTPPPGEGGSADGTGGASGGGSTGGSTGGSNDEDGGCRIGGSGHHAGALGLLLLLGLRPTRRRRR